MTPEAILNAIIDANILLLVACFVWMTALVLFSLFRVKNSFKTQLFLVNGCIAAVILCPLAALLLGGWTSQNSVSISDLVVANYLNGNFRMDAEQLQSVLGLRSEIVHSLVELDTWASKLIVGSLIGIAFVLIARLLFQGYRLKRQLQSSYLLKKIGKVRILVNEEVSTPYSTRGLSCRYVVLPVHILTEPLDLKIAIAHELQHFRQKDVEWEFLFEVLKPLFFWNPIYYLWRRQVTQLREYSCDQTIINRSRYTVRAYCECLLRASKAQTRYDRNPLFRLPSVALVQAGRTEKSTRSVLRKRILMMTGEQTKPQSKLIPVLVSISIISSVFTTSVLLQNSSDWSYDRLMLSTIINLKRMQ